MAQFGLDIGSSSVKVVQLEQQGEKFKLLAAGISTSPARLATGTEQDIVSLAESIKKLISDTKVSSREVNISLPESQVFTRLISLPNLTDEEVASAISWQAESYIPIPIEEANIDYQIVQRRNPQGAVQGSVDVLLVAAPKVLVDKYVQIADLAGLSINGIETEGIALARAIAPQDRTVLIIDLGRSSSNITVASSGQIMMSRSIATGGDVLSLVVERGLLVTPQQAEEYKKTYGLQQKQLEGKIRTVLEPSLRVIVEEIKKSIQYYRSELKREEAVTEVVVSGGVAGMPDLTTFLAENLGIEISIGDPFTKIIKDERLNQVFTAYAPLYGVAIGLAERL